MTGTPGQKRPRRGTEHTLRIDRLAYGGRGVARTPEGFVVFVEDALPGQLVRSRLLKVKKRFGEARVLEVLEEGPETVVPRCRHFGPCGGCRLQHLAYPAQLRAKTDQVREILERLGGFKDPPVEATIPSPRVFGYRNKMEFSFGDRRWLSPAEIAAGGLEAPPEPALGLHPRGRWDRVIQIEECHLPSGLSVEVLRAVQVATRGSRLAPYSTETHEGFWRFLVVRHAERTDQWMIDLITAEDRAGRGEVEALARRLGSGFPTVFTITHTINRSRASVATGEETSVLHGPGYIEEQIADLIFRISPRSFFQTNTVGAERLYEEARVLAALTGTERVWDVYCGTGTIALLLARNAGEVVGFERDEAAVVDARANAERNGIRNATFVEGDAASLLDGSGPWGSPDVIVLDPPRAGLHPDVCAAVSARQASRLVYVSCNPTTLARDLKQICATGYRLTVVKPLDMFPHTPHVETACLLTPSGST